jgi:integrase
MARDYALLLFLYSTGARVGEVLAVRPDDLRLTPHLGKKGSVRPSRMVRRSKNDAPRSAR